MLLLVKGSDHLTTALWVVGLVFLVVMAILAFLHFERARVAALRKASRELGLEFQAKDSGSLRDHVRRFKIGRVGRSRRVNDVIRGTWTGLEVLFCNYRYTVGGGNSQHTRRQSLMIMQLEGSLPNLQLGPEGFFSKIGQVFGAADIDFPAYPEFSKRYLLKGDDEEGIRDYFSPLLIEFFEKRRGLALEVLDNELVYYRPGTRCKPDALEFFLTEGYEVCAALEEASLR